ncbi:hypothetical protein QBC44DRAFT_229742 [Cladorrhinum sp. PSN332]|nr:hypothetical protein QBC44DRAFT_229742 [Cladorrhinum sp. PSN332]
MKINSPFVAITLLACEVSAHCPRSFLVDAAKKYVSAQAEGKPATLTALTATTVNYTESDKTVDINTGVLSKPLKIDHSRSIHDTTLCATFTEIIATDPERPYVIGTRILYSDHKATLIDTIATKPGDWAFNATGYLHWNSREKWDPIPVDKRDTRAVIQAAGDAYFDRFKNVSYVVPFGTPCARLEGGAYTDPRGEGGNTCGLGLPSTLSVVNRRYVVDEELGAVAIYVGFPGLDRSVGNKPMPDSHFFRVEGGQIRYIHTVTTCENAGCGMNGTMIPQKRG